uniref:NADH-ubiquinone oxidoreductase chain 3 n=1 Tax=Hydatigera parva TaxID=1434711 RepID=N0DLF6_9CEST|nr:NADH dehydrogenase subunit 3 [Hydatigera parva]BAN15661.1 NADH dehydrogenase subunit 3 [Hydatigera parva]
MLVTSFLVFTLLMLIIYFFNSGILNKIVSMDFSWCSYYECGFFNGIENVNCFSFTYFSLLVIFVVFDLEVSLLLNMPFQDLLYWNFVGYYCFIILLFIGFLIESSGGYVCWMY